MAWTTADLLATVLNRQMFPDASTGSLSPAALLQFATEELHLQLVPLILAAREKYYETYTDTVYSTATASLMIPARAIGGTLSAVQYIYSPDIRQIHPIEPSTINTLQPSAYPTNFYFQNDSIVFYPPPNGSQGTIRMRYLQRPNRLEQVANCAQITAVDPVGLTCTCSSVPAAWSTSNILDFIPQTASQATPYGLNSAILGITGNVISFTALPTNPQTGAAPAVGDWIALAEYTPIPEIPFEFQPLLAQLTAVAGLGAVNDTAGLTNAAPKTAAYQKAATTMITPRDTQGQKKVNSGWRRW